MLLFLLAGSSGEQRAGPSLLILSSGIMEQSRLSLAVDFQRDFTAMRSKACPTQLEQKAMLI
ncbi:hypothetical protein DEM27_28685 [Metarhizobium album]|uniref:Uncharacterized protein n=1 Tax=Metarhizobium album TaxID=2182425 RepID=A0A2U2DHK8_9HYPH|nr:hypothetical protein DEM27_28685 [Rhizobium album]